MIRGAEFPQQPSVGLDGGSAELSAEHWRDRQPMPVFVYEEVILKNGDLLAGETSIRTDEEAAALSIALQPIKEQVFDGLAKGFEATFRPNYDGSPGVRYWRPELGKVRYEEGTNLAVFNPVYLGPMTNLFLEVMSESDLDKFKEGLKVVTPEVTPMAWKRAEEMGVPPIDPNFVNLIFIQDNYHIVDRLSADQRVALSRSFFAGLGSWKADIVTYSLDGDGVAHLNNVTMATLEGGHPSFGPDELDELGWRHKVFAATTKIDVHKVAATKSGEIPYETWVNSPTVEGIRQSGRELGRRGLLSDSVTMDSLVTDRRLARMLQGLARFSQQGEGALFAWDPGIAKLLVSSTGQMGAMKANLQLNEVVAIEARDGDTIEMVPVAKMGEPLKPSVEGPEFGYPIWELLEHHPVYIATTQAGYVLSDNEEGAYKVPPIRAGGHLHRGVEPQANLRVAHLKTSALEWPPVGCGVDASDEYSHFVFNEAVNMWEESGRQLEFVTYDVPGHSTNYVQFYVAGRLNPANHAESLIEAIDNGEMVFSHDVRQVTEKIKPQPHSVEIIPRKRRIANFLIGLGNKVGEGLKTAEEISN